MGGCARKLTMKRFRFIKTFIIILVTAFAITLLLQADFREEYEVVPEVQRSDEQKLTEHLLGVMIQQKDARKTRERAENALIDAVSLEELANAEVDKAITNIKLYQGIE